MKQNVQFTCRGCREVAMDDAISLLSPGIRELYEKCTYIALPDPATDTQPTNICQECYTRCQEWLLFKTRCNDNECQGTEPVQLELEPMDWSMEDIVLRVEEDEDDLLAILEGNEVVVEKPPQKDLVEEKDNERGSDLMAEIDQIKEFIIESVKEEQGEIITLNDSFEEGKSDEVEPAVTSISIETAEIVCLLENESQGTGTDIVVIPVECKEDSDKEDVISLCGSNIEDPDDMFVIPANSEYEDTEQVVNQMDVPKDTELEKGEGVISSTTDIDNATSQPSQESVEFWVCPVCGANLIDSEMYRDHLQWHLTEDEPKTPIPIQWRRKRPAPEAVVAEKPKEGLSLQIQMNSWNCPLCVVILSNKTLLEDHLRHYHQLDDDHMCPICPPSVKHEYSSLIRHIFRVHVERFKCQFCFEEFRNFNSFSKHIQKMHDITRQLDQHFRSCPLCDNPCKKAGLREHLAKKHDVTDGCLNCPSCCAQYESTEGVITHIISFHATKWNCRVCKARFYSAHSFHRHIKMHSNSSEVGPKKAKFFCEKCDRIFIKYRMLKYHMKRLHTPEPE